MPNEKESIFLEYLVLHCQHRDKAAWEELVGLYEKRLYYFIKQMVGSHEEALNILQETWLKAYYSMHRLREPACLTAWLYTIARRMALQNLRRRGDPMSLDDCPDVPAREESAEKNFSVEEVHHGLKQLTLPHREALVLFYLEDFSLLQIAEILNIPVGTVRSRLHYAKKSLRNILEKEI